VALLHRHAVSPSDQGPPSRREHWHALLLAFACAVLFLRSGLLPGNALVPHPPELFDVQMSQALAEGTFDPDDAYRGNVGMGDKYLQSLCWDRVMQDRFRAGELPRWTRDIGGGAPFVPQMAQPWQPINALLLVVPSAQWYGLWFLLHQVLFGWFCYLFLRRIGCRHEAALLGLVAAVLGMWTQCKLHHNVILTAALSLWPMLSATHELVQRGATGRARRRAVAWLAMWAGLSWSSGFVVVSLQATYLTLLFAAFCAWQAPRGERLRRLAPVGFGFAIGSVLSFANMLPVLFASADSARAGTFVAERLMALGLEWDLLLTLCWPDLLSWPADCFYPPAANADPLVFGTGQPLSQLVLLADPLRPEDRSEFQTWVETSCAVGLVPLAAAVCAVFDRQHRRLAALFAVVAALAFAFATAEQPWFSIARLLPGLTAGDLRRQLFTVSMALVVLCGLGADAWLRGAARVPGRALLGAVAATSCVALWWLWQNAETDAFVRAYVELYAMDGDHPDVLRAKGNVDLMERAAQRALQPGQADDNWWMLFGSATRALLVSGTALALLWRPRRWTLLAAVALTVVELLVTGLGPVQTVPAERITTVPNVFAPVAAETVADQPRPRLQRLVAKDNGRSNRALPGNVPGFLGLADATGYNPLPPARYEQFFEAIEAGCAYGGAGVGPFHVAASLSHPLCDLYGIRYIVTRDDVAATATLLDRTPSGTGEFRLLERTTAMPRATFVRDVDVLPDRDARLQALARADRDVRRRIVLEHEGAKRPSPADDWTADVTVTRHDDELVELHVTCSHDGYVRLADPFDPGWTATVDGEAADVLVADHYLRAVFVDAGEHDVAFRYDGARVVWPLRFTLLAWLVIGWLWLPTRRKA